MRSQRPVLGWMLGGAVAFPALIQAFEYLRTPSGVAVAIGVGIAGIALGAALAAAARHDRAWRSAPIWAAAFASGILLFLFWPEYSEPLARPGDLNIVTPGRGRPLLSPEAWHAVARVVYALLIPALLGGLTEGARLAPGRRLAGAWTAAVGWAMGLALLPVLVVIGIYATHILGVLLPWANRVPAHLLGLTLSGALCGAAIGSFGERALQSARGRRLQHS